MKKILDIPVYGVCPSKLDSRVKSYISELQKEFKDRDTELVTTAIDIETFPKRNFEYNHIGGYIRVSVSKTDMWFDIFLPVPIPKRYVWQTTKKVFVQDINANGTHFYLGNINTNEEICHKATIMLNQVILDHIPSRFFVDTEPFYTINHNLDYLKIIKEL